MFMIKLGKCILKKALSNIFDFFLTITVDRNKYIMDLCKTFDLL